MLEGPLQFILVDYLPTCVAFILALLLWLFYKANEDRIWARHISVFFLITGLILIGYTDPWQRLLAHWQDRGTH